MNLSWELMYGIGALALLCALAYAAWQYHHRNRANDPVTEAATREVYDTPNVQAYQAKREALKDEVRPS